MNKCIKGSFVLLFLMFSCSDYIYNNQELKSILGVEVVIEKRIFSKMEWSGFQGEGYTINVYQLSDPIIQNFLDSNRYKVHPVLIDDLETKTEKWRKTPMTKKFEEVKFMVTRYFTKDEKVLEFQKVIEDKLNSEGTYFAFYYKGNSLDEANQVYFFLIDPISNRFYVVEATT